MMFWRLPNGTVAMLAFGYAGKINEFATSVGPRFLMIKSLGYAGEVGAINAWTGFAIGMWGWAFIILKLFEAGNTSSEFSDAVRTSFNNMRFIVSVRWVIYPLGYLFGTLTSAADPKLFNVI